MSNHFLSQVSLFADLSEADLNRLCERAGSVQLEDGQVLFSEGDAGDSAYVVETGELEILKRVEDRDVLLAVRKSGEVIGEMALIEEAPRMASVRARGRTRLVAIDQEQLNWLVQQSGSAARAMFYTVLARWRSTGAMLRQSEKMAQLGTLTAGVAHELNNPAAAVKRGADHLRNAMQRCEVASARLRELVLDEAQSADLEQRTQRAREEAHQAKKLESLARSDREQEIEEWLEEQGVSDPWELAPALVELGLDHEALERMAQTYATTDLPVVFEWLAAIHAAYSVLSEVSHGAERISKIVLALKQYSFLDQAPVQDIDVHEGIDNTLLILRSKINEGIRVFKHYAKDLPTIHAHGSALNQVWTNILDNACDALGGQGTITIRTSWDADWVTVEIEDDGPGIPEAIQERVFDAFFTTKPPGKGSGQGLDISWRIVVNDHRGSIKLHSRPGSTRFVVRLPINFEKGAAAKTFEETSADEQWILDNTNTIAVVGISANEELPAHTVPRYLQDKGFRLFPVNPKLEQVLGVESWPDLSSLPEVPDTVLVFRQAAAVPAIVDEAIKIGAKAVWMQQGIVAESAADTARNAGLRVVMDRCMRQAHKGRSAKAR